MSRAQRAAVLVGILGLLVAVAVLFVPITYVSSRGGGIYGGAEFHCGAPIERLRSGQRGSNDSCYAKAKDRVTIAAVVAGVSILGAGAAVWLLAPAHD